jgi:hypothetical protein
MYRMDVGITAAMTFHCGGFFMPFAIRDNFTKRRLECGRMLAFQVGARDTSRFELDLSLIPHSEFRIGLGKPPSAFG